MAQVYLRVGGKKLEKLIAMHVDVQHALDEAALEKGAEAESRLIPHFRTGRTKIRVEKGDVDRYVILDAGSGDALAIEFGRGAETRESANGDTYEIGRAAGLHILTDTFKLRERGQ